MEKYINDTLKWFDENQNHADARELFTGKIQETEEFFAPFYAACKSRFNEILFLFIFK